MKDRKKTLLWAGIAALLTAVFTTLVCTVDVAPIGPMGTSVGLSHLNGWAAERIGVHWLWYDITGGLGMAALALVGVFGCVGLAQWIRRKKLRLVDRSIWALGGLYAVTMALYVFFEKVVINCRPVVMPGEVMPETSFPSSHTLLSCVVLGSALMVLPQYVKRGTLRSVLTVLLWAALIVIVVGRLASGVHWLTDITAGLLYGATLLLFFKATIS